MLPLLTPEEMAAADAATISSGVPAEVLMERAGRAVARAAIRLMGGRYGKRVVIVCGKGNNGGDGFVAARVLARHGASPDVLLVHGEPRRGAALHHFSLLMTEGLVVRDFSPVLLEGADLIVDAIFGTGFSGAPEGDVERAIAAINGSGAKVLAVDIPSGVDGATGATPGAAVNADATLVIEAQKIGIATGPGSAHAGAIELVGVGIALRDARTQLAEEEDVRRVLPVRDASAHKGSTGSLAVMAGSVRMAGAAVLTCRAADRAGAGYVRLGSVKPVKDVVAIRLPEVLCTDIGQAWSEASARDFMEVAERSDAVAFGPGIGTGGGEKAAVLHMVAAAETPLLLDADALNNIAGLTGPLKARSAPTILTPHPGEMGRLLDVDISEVQADRVAAARRAAEMYGAIVLLKGPRSVVAHPDGRVVINPTGSAALATAGSGDVLTGAIGAFLAAGVEAFEAAWAGAFMHGRAGEVAGRLTTTGVVAWDLAESLPAARASVMTPGANLSQ